MWAENCYYSRLPLRSYYDVDGFGNTDSRYCYECLVAMNCYKCQYVIYSQDCRSCKYMLDCRDCEYCFACVNIAHKRYYIYNKQYDKATYQEMLKTLEQEDRENILQKFIQFSLSFPKKATR